MRASFLYPVLMFLSLPSGCENLDKIDYSDFADIPQSGIPQYWKYDFVTTEKDSAQTISGVHDAVIAVRYTNECKSRSVFLDIEEYENGNDTSDTLRIEIPLFDDAGKALGKGIYGIYEVSDTIRRNFKVNDGYIMSVSTPMKESSTAGIKSIGFILSRR